MSTRTEEYQLGYRHGFNAAMYEGLRILECVRQGIDVNSVSGVAAETGVIRHEPVTPLAKPEGGDTGGTQNGER